MFREGYAKDGLGTNIFFVNCPEDLHFTEVSMKPPGWSRRGKIDITNLRNRVVTTGLNKSLSEATNMTLTVQASTDRLGFNGGGDLLNLISFNQQIYVRFPPNMLGLRAVYRLYGWCDELNAHEFKEGELPLYDMTVIISSTTPQGAEAPPTFTGMV